MALNIPDGLFDKYYEGADWFIDTPFIGQNCTLIYPPKRIECINCIKPVGISLANIYRHGGPAPFTFGSCPLCGGVGYKEQEVTGTIRLRIYHSRRDWMRYFPGVNIPDAEAMVIGYLRDLPNLRRAIEIILISNQNNTDYRMNLAAEPFPHGFGKNRYFMAFLKRV